MVENADAATVKLFDGLDVSDVMLLEAEDPTHVGLFAVGRGGNPMRHFPLLQALAKQGCTIIAPHFEMLSSTIPTKVELDMRIRRLEASVEVYGRKSLPIVGIGHSIGTVALLALAGGEGETRTGDRLITGSKWRLGRLALLAPPADFFRRPGALRALNLPIRLWAGAKDTITPPDQALFLKEQLEPRVPVKLSINADAGHFTYMNEPPPQFPEPHPDRSSFLAALATEVASFVIL